MLTKFSGIRIRAIGAASGRLKHDVVSACSSFLDERHARRLVKTLGFETVREVPLSMTTSDLCVEIAKRLLKGEGIDPGSVGALVLVTQTNDSIAPATVFSMQQRLGLSEECFLDDIINGCAGSVHGLFEGCSLIASGAVDRVIVCFGDTYCKIREIDESDQKANAALFGDGAGAVIIERDPKAEDLFFAVRAHGILAGAIRDNKGSERAARVAEAVQMGMMPPEALEPYKKRGIQIAGTAIASYAIDQVIPCIADLLGFSGFPKEEISCFLLHQANKTVLKAVALSMEVPEEKIPFAAKDTGNTSSASLALAMTESETVRDLLKEGPAVLGAFGVGMNCACMAGDLGLAKIYDTLYF